MAKPSALKNTLKFGWAHRKPIYRHLAIQTKNGVPIERALDTYLPRLARNRQKYVASVISSVARRFRDGHSLADALLSYIPDDDLAVIRSGELGGSLAESLELIIASTDSTERVKNAIRQAAFAPSIYAFATFVLLWVIGRFVLPDLQNVLPAQRAQGSVALLYILGDTANSLWALVIPALIAAALLWLSWAMQNWTNPIRLTAERFFPFSFYRDTSGFRWLMSFTSLMGAGVPDVEILQAQARGASPWLGERLRAFHRAMINGASLSSALLARSKGGKSFGFPNPDIADDIGSFDGFPDFHANIQSLAKDWARDLEDKTLLLASRLGFYCEMVLFGIMALLMVAINELSTQISHVAGA
jgi:type II secretory pathway component PulF